MSLPGALDYDSRPSSIAPHDSRARAQAKPLYCAASCGFARLVKYLIIMHGEDVNERCGWDMAPLHAASRSGHVDCARLLLDHGAHVNASAQLTLRWTPVHFASYDGHLSVAQLLLQHGASLHAPDDLGTTPLYLVSESGCLEIVRLLLDHGADVSVRRRRGTRWTPFQVATMYRHHDVRQLLLEYGAERESVGGTVE
jgi:ankyrin repeat protein